MGVYDDQVLPRLMTVVCGNQRMAKVRRRALEGLSGTVVELGFGAGPNVPLYPAEVERVYAVEPSDVARRLARKRIDASVVPVELVGLDGQDLPLPDASADAVLSTWTLCTIPDVERALQECRRVLVPGGRLFFLEHGLAENPVLAGKQRRWTPMQQRIAGGCRLDRPIDDLVTGAGFEIERLFRFTLPGPKTMNAMYAGVGVNLGG